MTYILLFSGTYVIILFLQIMERRIVVVIPVLQVNKIGTTRHRIIGYLRIAKKDAGVVQGTQENVNVEDENKTKEADEMQATKGKGEDDEMQAGHLES